MPLAAPCLLPPFGVAGGLGLGLGSMALNPWRGQAAAGLSRRVARPELPLPWAGHVLALSASSYTLADRLAPGHLTWTIVTPRNVWMASSVGTMAATIVPPIPLGKLPPTLALMLLGAWHRGSVGLTALWPAEAAY